MITKTTTVLALLGAALAAPTTAGKRNLQRMEGFEDVTASNTNRDDDKWNTPAEDDFENENWNFGNCAVKFDMVTDRDMWYCTWGSTPV
jgi:hypothetical protein